MRVRRQPATWCKRLQPAKARRQISAISEHLLLKSPEFVPALYPGTPLGAGRINSNPREAARSQLTKLVRFRPIGSRQCHPPVLGFLPHVFDIQRSTTLVFCRDDLCLTDDIVSGSNIALTFLLRFSTMTVKGDQTL